MPEPLRRWWNIVWLAEIVIGFTFRNLEGASWAAWLGALLLLGVGYYFGGRDGLILCSLPIVWFVLAAKLGNLGVVLSILLTVGTFYALGYIH